MASKGCLVVALDLPPKEAEEEGSILIVGTTHTDSCHMDHFYDVKLVQIRNLLSFMERFSQKVEKKYPGRPICCQVVAGDWNVDGLEFWKKSDKDEEFFLKHGKSHPNLNELLDEPREEGRVMYPAMAKEMTAQGYKDSWLEVAPQKASDEERKIWEHDFPTQQIMKMPGICDKLMITSDQDIPEKPQRLDHAWIKEKSSKVQVVNQKVQDPKLWQADLELRGLIHDEKIPDKEKTKLQEILKKKNRFERMSDHGAVLTEFKVL